MIILVFIIMGVLGGSYCVEAGPRMNGFKLHNSSVPVSEILHGGPPRDGIPSIDAPEFETASKALARYAENERVIMVGHGAIMKLYPISIMNYHEIVNDSFGGKRLTVTYCPLCGTGIAFETPKGVKRFGVSGLLYQSDVLLYDDVTESLWSQIMRQAVSGARKGERLKVYPSRMVFLREALKSNPSALVLQAPKGFFRNYAKNPYEGYGEQNVTYFPTRIRSSNAKAPLKSWSIVVVGEKEQVLFIMGPKYQGIGTTTVSVGGTKVLLKYNGKTRELSCEPTPNVECMTGYYFALHSFFPDAKVVMRSEP